MLRSGRALLLVIAMLSFESATMTGHEFCTMGADGGQSTEAGSMDHGSVAERGSDDCAHAESTTADESGERAPASHHGAHECAIAQSCVATALPSTRAVDLAALPSHSPRPAAPAALIVGLRPAPDVPPPRA